MEGIVRTIFLEEKTAKNAVIVIDIREPFPKH
jgi:hypothetical protein